MTRGLNELPSVSHYARGQNAICFSLGPALEIYFSYRTPIAFRDGGHLRVRQNDWSSMTGQHLAMIDGGRHADRIPGPRFEAELADVLRPLLTALGE